MKTGIVILAAGESARMGEAKQLLDFHGKTLLQHAIDTALAIPDARVAGVLGARADRIRDQFDGSPVLVVENPDWKTGMGSSVSLGLRAVLDDPPEIDGIIFLTCDQPHLTPSILTQLISARKDSACAIAAAEYDDSLGVPALFDKSLFPELLALDGASGAHQIIRKHHNQTVAVPFPEGSIDIDTPSDYARLCEPETITHA
jgi:molybdenum cofactor cytidylyltransferase